MLTENQSNLVNTRKLYQIVSWKLYQMKKTRNSLVHIEFIVNERNIQVSLQSHTLIFKIGPLHKRFLAN